MKILSNMAKQVRSLLNIEDISLDPRIGIAMQFAAKDRKNIYVFFKKLTASQLREKPIRSNDLMLIRCYYQYFDTTNLLN